MHNQALTRYVGAFVDELTVHGVTKAVISPGSRSTPLAMLLYNHPSIETWIHMDERSAAFFALGMAKASGEPVVLVCTSGSAAANYFPAVVEAYHSQIPLLIVTADRPHELREIGAPQAMNQQQLYGNYSKWFKDVALPEDREEMYHYIRNIVRRAVWTTTANPAGPVQLNVPLREPLVPNLTDDERFEKGRSTFVHQRNVQTMSQWCEQDEEALYTQLARYERPLIVYGDGANMRDAQKLLALATELSIPVLADPLSNGRAEQSEMIIDTYDVILRKEKWVEVLQPDCVIRLGAMPVSKVLTQFLAKSKADVWQFGPIQHYRDPIHRTSIHCDVDIISVLQHLVKMPRQMDERYVSNWVMLQGEVSELLEQYPFSLEHEGLIIREVLRNFESHKPVFVSNSMPIRDVDTFLRYEMKRSNVYGNRGVNGIDGIVSTAMGVAAVKGETLLITGDLAYFHDSNGMLMNKLYKLPLKVLLLNNDGGGIFSFLAQAEEKECFEQLFGTPHGIEFAPLVAAYGGTYKEIFSEEDLKHAIQQEVSGLTVFEIKTNRQSNHQAHVQLQATLADTLEGVTLNYGDEEI